jgi:hypothetical protein
MIFEFKAQNKYVQLFVKFIVSKAKLNELTKNLKVNKGSTNAKQRKFCNNKHG